VDYTKLRSYDTNSAKEGDKVCCVTGVGTSPLRTGEVLAVKHNQLVIDWADARTFTVQGKTDYHQIKLFPLCWVEEKPVYAGDILYSKELRNGDPCKIQGMTLFTVSDVTYTCKDRFCQTHFKNLTWTKPVVTANINGFDVLAPETEPPKEGTLYWIPVVSAKELASCARWAKDAIDNRSLKRGLVHLTKEAAQAHAKALLSFTEREEQS